MQGNREQAFTGETTGLLGAETTDRSGPVRPFWINLDAGVVVIYGKNGSGKSHVLRRLARIGSDYSSYLYLRSRPPHTEDGELSIWTRLNFEAQEGLKGFHDSMHNFLDESARYYFSEKVHLYFTMFLVDAFQQDQEPETLAALSILQDHLSALQLPDEVGRKTASSYDLPLHLFCWSQLIQLLAYRLELFKQDEALFKGIVYAVSHEALVHNRFVINNDQLFLLSRIPDSGIGALLASLEPNYRNWDYIDFIREFGGLGDAFDNWRENEDRLRSPWRGLQLKTGVQKPLWGTVVADLDLDQRRYSEQTSQLFIDELKEFLYAERRLLPSEDERCLDYSDSGNKALLLETEATVKWDPRAQELVREAVNAANDLFQSLLQTDLELICSFTPISEWGSGLPIAWGAKNRDGMTVELEELSWAEQRWASFAIQLSTPSTNPPSRILLIDEPERGLHRQAERRLALALLHYSLANSLTCVLATHSPAFLSLPDARLHHLWKGADGLSNLDTLPRNIEPWIEELGLQRHDLLQLCRLFLIVEGEHDALILNGLFEEEFNTFGVRAIPLRGLRNLTNATDASFIFRFTEATVMYLTDNERSFRISSIWHDALIARPEDRLNVIDRLTHETKSAEAQFLKEFMVLASEFAARDRILFAALPAEDILDYLPVDRFISKRTTWADLRLEWKHSQQSNFKVWLQKTYGVDFSPNVILDSIHSMDFIPGDLSRLLEEILSAVR